MEKAIEKDKMDGTSMKFENDKLKGMIKREMHRENIKGKMCMPINGLSNGLGGEVEMERRIETERIACIESY